MILKAVAISILACGLTFAGEAEVKLPSSVKTIMEKTERDISKNKEVFETANDKVFSATEKALKSEMEKFTKAGKLDEAIVVKNLIENMRKDVIAKVNEKKDDGTDLLGDTTDIKSKIIGKWMVNHPTWSGVIEFKKDGQVATFNDPNKKTNDTWTYDPTTNQLVIEWTEWPKEYFSVDKEKNIIVGIGKPTTMRKLP